MKKLNFKPVLGIMTVAVLSACTMIPKYEQPNVAVTDTFKYDTAQNGIQASSLGWQDYFADPRLHRLIEIALERNTDLRTAALNAEAYRKQYMIQRANSLPAISATGSGGRSRTARDLSSTGNAYVSESYSVGLGITSYELDLFGKVRSNTQAALQGYFNMAATRDATHLSLIASVAKAYFNERYAEDSMALAKDTLRSYQGTYALMQLRYKAGVISAVDLRQQEALIESAKASYESAVQTREQARNALAVLINQPIPDDLPAGLPLDKQFKIRNLPAGLSSEVLLNRPDIRAAEFALKQANANIGAARAAFFPSITLTSTIGSGSTELSDLFKGPNRTWSFAPSINIPIFNWGSLKSSLDYYKIQQQVQVVAYEAAVQSAFQDVANALVAHEQLDKTYAAYKKQAHAYSEYLRLVQLRYKQGVDSALTLFEAQRSDYTAETTLLSNQLTRLENMADLYKVLGGGLKRFTNDAEPVAEGVQQTAGN
ncbi:efflux transporter outer membrane subunit [Neisseria perflava]|uniref:efflux transporter outer membrane subunit n=1 Tax=Neisseria perflava TaxID=33053 RepID=UPI00209FCE40|nr:efflux transporter outer membrane subunit [Neisseria perflava]